MTVRFIEYIEVNGKVVNLFIKQEIDERDRRCYRIQVHDRESFEFLLCRDRDHNWHIITQMFPDYIIKNLLTTLTESLNEKLQLEHNYLANN